MILLSLFTCYLCSADSKSWQGTCTKHSPFALFGVQEMENKLEQLTNENAQLEHYIHRVDLLQKNKVWKEVDLQNERVDSLKDAPESLKEQLKNIQQRLNSIEQKIVSAGIESPLGQV